MHFLFSVSFPLWYQSPMEADPTSTNSSPLSNQPNSTQNDPIVLLNHSISTKLTRNNYLSWQSQIVPLLHGYKLHQFLDATPPSPTITTSSGEIQLNSAYLTWHQQDQLLLGWLRSSLSEPILAQVVSSKTSSELWHTLQSFTLHLSLQFFMTFSQAQKQG